MCDLGILKIFLFILLFVIFSWTCVHVDIIINMS